MIIRYGAPILSLLRIARMVVEALTGDLRKRLGLGFMSRLAFLPRDLFDEADEQLRQIEHILRRILFLVAAEQDALPDEAPPMKGANKGAREFDKPRFGQGAGEAGRAPAPMLFRLTEPQTSETAPGAREYEPRFSPAIAVPHSAGAPACPPAMALVPAGSLARRLLAVEDVFRNSDFHVQRMRRCLGNGLGQSAAFLLSDSVLEPATRKDPPDTFRILYKLQAECQSVANCLCALNPDTG